MMKSTVFLSFLFSLFFSFRRCFGSGEQSRFVLYQRCLDEIPLQATGEDRHGFESPKGGASQGERGYLFQPDDHKETSRDCSKKIILCLKLPNAVPRYESWGLRGTPSFE